MGGVDGKIRKGVIHVKYGEDFPKSGEDRTGFIKGIGRCLIHIVHNNTPEWTDKLSVRVPIRFSVIKVLDPESEQDSKPKLQTNLRLVKNQ